MIADLKQFPAPLGWQCGSGAGSAGKSRQPPQSGVFAYLEKQKLSYSRRTVLAFHTALKINDYSQLTVLAGVSGTGKSLLPRRYAEAMGFRFLPIAVEPRWDSPQDLLGFYNYIEKRYRATDLARALVHMDPYNTSKLAEGKFGDQMMLCLAGRNEPRAGGILLFGISKPTRRPDAVFGSWRDEETQGGKTRIFRSTFAALAWFDKSIFPAPQYALRRHDERRRKHAIAVRQGTGSKQHHAIQLHHLSSRSYRARTGECSDIRGLPLIWQWRRWIQKPAFDRRSRRQGRVRRLSTELAQIMEDCGRPFGHRLNAAIFAYFANYPAQSRLGEGLRWAMVDQIEFRILPKLRGLRIDDHSGAFDRLEKFISETLEDPRFAARLREIVEKQRGSGGLFNWRGHTRNRDGA